MYSIKLDWKEHKIHLPDLESWCRINSAPLYVGNSAEPSGLTLWFSEDPGEEVHQRIAAHWASISEDKESAKIEHHKKLERVEAMARENLPYVDVADMIPAEKKMFMGRPLTLEDKEALVAKYPNY